MRTAAVDLHTVVDDAALDVGTTSLAKGKNTNMNAIGVASS